MRYAFHHVEIILGSRLQPAEVLWSCRWDSAENWKKMQIFSVKSSWSYNNPKDPGFSAKRSLSDERCTLTKIIRESIADNKKLQTIIVCHYIFTNKSQIYYRMLLVCYHRTPLPHLLVEWFFTQILPKEMQLIEGSFGEKSLAHSKNRLRLDT